MIPFTLFRVGEIIGQMMILEEFYLGRIFGRSKWDNVTIQMDPSGLKFTWTWTWEHEREIDGRMSGWTRA